MQREGEQNSKFLARKHCNTTCSRTNPNRTQSINIRQSEEERLNTKKRCPICSEDFVRRRSEPKAVFEKRETCGKVCASINRSKDRDTLIKDEGKTCENPECGKTFYRRKGNDTNSKFRKRRACSPKCGHVVRISSLGWTPRPEGKRSPTPKKKKNEVASTLPPVAPLKREIPDAPPPPPLPTWRPESWSRFPDCRPQVAS